MPGLSFFPGGSTLQIPLDAPTNLMTSAGNAKVSLTWTDPKDKYATPEGEQAQDPQQLVSVWAYTKIVRKIGSAPTGPNDGVAVVSSEVRNQYQSTPFVDTGVQNDTTYFYGAFAYNEDGVVSPGVFSEGVTPKSLSIYGAEWNGTETTKWTRIDGAADFSDPDPAVNNGIGSSPFDTLMPWSGMIKSEDPESGTLVAIPKFWYKITQISNNGMRIQIADGPVEGFYVSPAHMNKGDGIGERDIVYIGRYHCCESDMKSKSGELPKTDISRPNARDAIHSMGSTIWQADLAMRFTIWMLYIVEFADWNSQDKIGYGCSSGGSKFKNGLTDDMQYHTGTTAVNRTTYGCCQYRNIEGLWDNVFDWVDGCYSYYGLYSILNPSNFGDYSSSGGVFIGHLANGYPSKFTINANAGFLLFFPSLDNGSDSTYTCDDWYTNQEGGAPSVYAGGSFLKTTRWGLFGVAAIDVNRGLYEVGCRIQKLP